MPDGALPSFDLAESGFLLAFVRSLSVIALFSAYGTLVFRAFVAPRALDRLSKELAVRVDRRLRNLVWASLGISATALIAWLVTQSGVMADAPDFPATMAAVGPVVSETVFGHVILMQLAALLAIAVIFVTGSSLRRWRATAG